MRVANRNAIRWVVQGWQRRRWTGKKCGVLGDPQKHSNGVPADGPEILRIWKAFLALCYHVIGKEPYRLDDASS